ncbi:hypothetical protein JNUCC1_02076 [Lentibacillus sp. JNUCC-1]|nr:hypothetical protein [Lentibacillus sp. JNUCC-1]MUV38240.1 hypothetical protein [Lentibacillus sp. JNUCC-1]
MLEHLIQYFNLHVLSIDEVEDSHSSTVYKCHLHKGESVFLKIPYTRLKWQRELEAYQILKGHVSTPEMLDYWSDDEASSGAFLLSELKGIPLTTNVSPKVAYEVGVLQATMHDIHLPYTHDLTGIKNEFPSWSHFVERQFYSFAEDVIEVLDERLYT